MCCSETFVVIEIVGDGGHKKGFTKCKAFLFLEVKIIK